MRASAAEVRRQEDRHQLAYWTTPPAMRPAASSSRQPKFVSPAELDDPIPYRSPCPPFRLRRLGGGSAQHPTRPQSEGHRGVARRGGQGPPHRHVLRLRRRRLAGPGRQAGRRQHGLRPPRRGFRRSRQQGLPVGARPVRDRDVVRHRPRCLLRLGEDAGREPRRDGEALAPRADQAAFRRRAGRAHPRPNRGGNP